MRRWLRLLAGALLVASGVMLLLPSGTASAAASKTGVLQQAWFWQTAYEQANPPVAQAAPATEPSGVPDGDLAVAYTGTTDKSSSKMTVLSFDVSGIPSGASVSAFTFSLTVDSSPTATSFGTVNAPVVACLPTRSWPAVLGGDFTNRPTVDCSAKVPAAVNGSTYTFKIPAIAQTWLDDQNLGVAILADPDSAAAPFQLVFAGAKDVKADAAFTAAVTGGVGSPGSPGGSGAVTVPAPAAPAAAPPVSLPPAASNDVAGPAAAPVVAPSQPTHPQLAPVAARTAPAIPTKAFWAAALALGAILLAASLVLGDPTPVAQTAARSQLDRVLRSRSGSGPIAVRSL